MDALVRIVPVFSAKLGWSLKSVAVFRYGQIVHKEQRGQ